MSVVATNCEHIILNEHDESVIAATGMKVIQPVLDNIAYGWSSEELMFQHLHPDVKATIFGADLLL